MEATELWMNESEQIPKYSRVLQSYMFFGSTLSPPLDHKSIDLGTVALLLGQFFSGRRVEKVFTF